MLQEAPMYAYIPAKEMKPARREGRMVQGQGATSWR
jgi:hypothetical protein